MGISSLGAGSSILTQDVLDQLRAADEAGQIQPVTLNIANENDKQDALKLIDAKMDNLIDSINAIKSHSLFDERDVSVTGSSVTASAVANTDLVDFTLDVTTLATKQIEQSGSFTAADGGENALVSDDAGKINLNIDGEDFEISYAADTTLKELKAMINDIAGEKVDATILQVSSDDFRLFLSSANTGASQDIAITNLEGTIDSKISGLSEIQPGVDAEFTFNGQAITRSSNQVDDLVTGLKLTLNEVGSSNVSIAQDRSGIEEKFENFVEHYNAAIDELNKMTKPSVESGEKGIFSGESTIKSMKSTIQSMISTIGGGAGYLTDYGFDVDKDGKMSFDKDAFGEKLDDNSQNVEAFFAGGTFTKSDNTTVELTGAFTELSTKVESYTKYNATLDLFETSITDKISSLEDKKTTATERLDAKYEIMKKQFAAYDLMISKFNSQSSMFSQMVTAQNAAS